MKVLLVSQYYAPEIGATQNRMAAFVRALLDRGHEVDVLTEVPNHPAGVIPPAYHDRWFYLEGTAPARVARVWVATSPRKTFATRLAFYGSFALMAMLAGARLAKRYDVVAATSPPLPAAAAGLALSRWKRAPFVLDIRDIWPGAARALGELSNPAAYWAAERLEVALYRRAARVVATTQGFREHIAVKAGAGARIEVVANGTRLDLFTPDAIDRELPARLGVRAPFVAAYVGLHGIAQDLDTVLRAAERFREGEVTFLLVGDGPEKARLMREAAERRLSNVVFAPAVSPETCAPYLNAAHAMIVPLAANPVFQTFVPSKMFDAMACARPVLLAVDGEARTILERAGAGEFVPPGDPEALAAAIRRLSADPARAREIGLRGRAFVEQHYSRAAQAERFAAILEEAAAERRGGR
jgi:colanic acid biosynthesis glycosyl transferase WcaI